MAPYTQRPNSSNIPPGHGSIGRVGYSNGVRSNGKKARGGQNNGEGNYRRTLAYGNNYDSYDPRARPDMYAAATFLQACLCLGAYSTAATPYQQRIHQTLLIRGYFLLMVALVIQPRRCTHTWTLSDMPYHWAAPAMLTLRCIFHLSPSPQYTLAYQSNYLFYLY
jgi:hypothetical protein